MSEVNSRIQKAKKPRRRKKRKGWKKFWHVVRIIFLVGFLLVVGALIAGWFIFIQPLVKDLPDPDNLTENNERYGVSTQIFDRNGVKLYEIFSGERRVPIKLDEVPTYLLQATVAIEDKNFYNHFGFDPKGILRAYLANQETGGFSQGGSTITQQLVKKAFLTAEKSYERKIKELFLSLLVENQYDKDTILEMYLNYISYGGTSVGIGAAAESYFDKQAKDLTLAESAFLAGLPQSPSKYSPFTSDASAATARQAEVLGRMIEDGYITNEQAEIAKSEPLEFALKKTDIKAPHFVFYIRDYLVEKYGEDKVERGGLRVQTTLDLELQEAAQASVAAEVANLANAKVGNGAAIVTVPDTGEILAMVGSKDYFDREHDGQVNVTTAMRQPGSSIKPLVYATAFEQKLLNPGSVLIDQRTCFTSKYQEDYCPRNYSGTFSGPVSIRESLGSSLNIPAVKAIRMTGIESFINQANKMGIESLGSARNYGLSLSLGGGEVMMTEMAEAFAVLNNEGIRVPLTGILEITDYTGKVLEKNNPEEKHRIVMSMNESEESEEGPGGIERVMSRAPAWMTAEIMRDNQARQRGFGLSSKLIIQGDREHGPKAVSVKTGTTNDMRDNWAIGFTPEYLVAVWVGNNDNTPMNNRVVSGVTGATPIWNDIMSYLLEDTTEVVWPEPPSDVVKGRICITGMPKMYDFDCAESKEDYYWTASRPTRSQIRTEGVWIDKATGAPPPEGAEVGDWEIQERVIYSDPMSENYCADCERVTDPETGEPVSSGEQSNVPEDVGIKMIGD